MIAKVFYAALLALLATAPTVAVAGPVQLAASVLVAMVVHGPAGESAAWTASVVSWKPR